MVARSCGSGETAEIHGNETNDWEFTDGGHTAVWERLVIGARTLKTLRSFWHELGEYLKHVKKRTKDLD